MDTYVINGGNRLSGEINLQGSKNSALPIIAASILVDGNALIKRCPIIRDTVAMKELLLALGCKVSQEKNLFKVDATNCNKDEIP